MQSSWLDSFIRWLKRLLGLNSVAVSHVELLEEYHAENGSCSVFRLQDRTIPGAIDLWKIERHREGVGWFCLAIDLPTLRQDLVGTGLSPIAYFQRHHSVLAGNLGQQLAEQQRYFATHYWICGCSTTYAGIDSKGRAYKTRRFSCVKAIAGDYQGVAGAFAGNRHIERTNRKIVDQLANNRFREFTACPTWKMAICSIDWADWHEGILRQSIAPDHHFQVLRPNPKGLGSIDRL